MQPKKILYVVPSSGFGGAETFLGHTASFHSPEVEPIYFIFREGPLAESLRISQRRVFVASKPPRLSRPWDWWLTTLAIATLARRERVALIHSTMAYGALFGACAAFLAKCPHAWFQHGPVTGWMDRLAGILPTAAIFVNSRHTAQLQRNLSPRRPLRQIQLGVDLNHVDRVIAQPSRAALREQLGARHSTFVVGSVCRPQPQKGLDHFVRAIGELSARGENDVLGVIVGTSAGENSEYESGLRALANEMQAPITFIPATRESMRWISSFDLLVSSATAPEAFGFTLLEAVALGVPALAPREGGPLSFLRADCNGDFFEPRNWRDLAEQMAKARATEPDERALRARTGMAEVRTHFAAARGIADLETAYQEITLRC
jgi:glycosyltransferase involved in cell wall biosynthesis